MNELATHVYRDFDNIAVLDDLHQQLNKEHDHFRELAYDFRDFLNPTNRARSIEELAHHKEKVNTLSKTADDALKHIISVTKAMIGAYEY